MQRFLYYKIKKIKTIDITFMAMMLALYILLEFATGYSLTGNYLVLNLKFIPIMLLAAYTDWLRTAIVCLLGGLSSFFLPTNVDAGIPGAFLFDYLIPVLLVIICSITLPRNYENKKKYWITWVINLTILCFLFFWSRTFAGVIFYGQYAPAGKSIWIYSMSVNAINTSFDYAIFLILMPSTCFVLKPLKKRVYA